MAFGNRLIHTESAAPVVGTWDISNGFSGNGQFNPSTQGGYISRGSEFDPSGSFYNFSEYPTNQIFKYTTGGTPYNFNNYTNGGTAVLDPPGDYGSDMRFVNDGNILLLVLYKSAVPARYIATYDLTTPYNISTATNYKELITTSFDTRVLGANFIDNGNKLITRDYSASGPSDFMFRIYSVSVPYDILSTKTLISSLNLPSSTVGMSTASGMGVLAQNNGSQILISIQTTTNNILLINFETPFDLSSNKTYQLQTISGLNVGNLAMSVDESYIAFGVEPTAQFYCYLVN